jgi:hypothetical protein
MTADVFSSFSSQQRASHVDNKNPKPGKSARRKEVFSSTPATPSQASIEHGDSYASQQQSAAKAAEAVRFWTGSTITMKKNREKSLANSWPFVAAQLRRESSDELSRFYFD